LLEPEAWFRAGQLERDEKAAASRRTPRTVAATSVRCLHYNSPLDPLDRSELTGRQSYSVPLCLGG